MSPQARTETATVTKRSTALQLAEPDRIEEQLTRHPEKLAAILEEQHISSERFVRVVVQTLARNEKLKACTAESVLWAVMEAAQLGLEPTGVLGMAYLVPYFNGKKRVHEAKLITGYRGYIDLMRRSGEVRTIESRVVYEGDWFDAGFGLDQKLRHIPWYVTGKSNEEAGDRRFVYWLARLASGEAEFDIIPMTDVEAARRVSKAADDGPWVEWYDEMAKKTAIRRAVKILPVAIWQARRAASLEDEAEADVTYARVSAPPRIATTRDRALAAISGETAAAQATESAEDGQAAEPTEEPVGATEGEAEAPSASQQESDEDLPDLPEPTQPKLEI